MAEALALHLMDVTVDGLLIRNTTCKNSRVLPLPVTTRAALDDDLAQRRRVAGTDAHLFVSRRHGPRSRTVVTPTFHQGLMAAGLPRKPGRGRPRRIDRRHPVAVRTLEAGPEPRERVGRPRLALTTSMGHPCVASTDWSLERTPHLLADMAATCEAFVSGGIS